MRHRAVREVSGRAVTYLVDHHHSQQVADGGKEQAVHIVAHGVADLVAEGVQNHLAKDEEEDAK